MMNQDEIELKSTAEAGQLERPVMREYSEGICGDGAAILCDGEPMPIELIVARLANFERWCIEIVGLASGWDEHGAISPKKPYCWETVGRVAMDYANAALNDNDA
jgi:hypothetical protein